MWKVVWYESANTSNWLDLKKILLLNFAIQQQKLHTDDKYWLYVNAHLKYRNLTLKKLDIKQLYSFWNKSH